MNYTIIQPKPAKELHSISDEYDLQLKLEAAEQHEPWATVFAAQGDTNWNITYNRNKDLPSAEIYAKQIWNLENNNPLTWTGAVDLYNIYTKLVEATGKEFKLEADPRMANDVVNQIISTVNTDHDVTWMFFTTLYWDAKERGVMKVILPKTVAANKTPNPGPFDFLGPLLPLLYIGVGLYAINTISGTGVLQTLEKYVPQRSKRVNA